VSVVAAVVVAPAVPVECQQSVPVVSAVSASSAVPVVAVVSAFASPNLCIWDEEADNRQQGQQVDHCIFTAQIETPAQPTFTGHAAAACYSTCCLPSKSEAQSLRENSQTVSIHRCRSRTEVHDHLQRCSTKRPRTTCTPQLKEQTAATQHSTTPNEAANSSHTALDNPK
jgi:hypothetical protein